MCDQRAFVLESICFIHVIHPMYKQGMACKTAENATRTKTSPKPNDVTEIDVNKSRADPDVVQTGHV